MKHNEDKQETNTETICLCLTFCVAILGAVVVLTSWASCVARMEEARYNPQAAPEAK